MICDLARRAGVRAGVRPVVSKAETLRAEPEYLELAVTGNAFHRLDRDLVAAFDADLAGVLGPYSDGGTFTETVEFAYGLARTPASLSIADGTFAGREIQAQ